ncbi:MotA/TolQ/ExbB proton channel family protein [Ornithobacterium rhinotracheale]|uniref:MotA/TolQ/ExbB proton channel family protein n=1 Tax=Ornithobacterium rhinotracheale TaxID=28251 RepID=UPI00129CC6C7|nr:MotA/TolQ/ExbB proton channel family protein [Ornithobacterium rhinotracheale]MRJ08439.1 MotA/TolQ/ExbB proton channel family protein [Ornithobacterium rhinotracheale]UOH77633.1 MotA/TolQ/ExbB proton channel family protein [Ornithobacterium rhinotracheale]
MEQQDSLSLAQILADSASQTTEVSLLEMIQQGGWFGGIIIFILFLLLLFTVYLFFERYLSINKQSRQDYYFINNIRDFVYENKIPAAIELCKRTNTPESRMIEKGLLRIGRPLKEISEAIENTGKLEVYKLEKNVNYLATIAGAAPMLGFLGTVVGMIMSFAEIANTAGQVDAKLLSSGIYAAMLTTAAGLVVGISAYIAYNFLVMEVDKSVHQMESTVTEFLEVINKPVVK